MTPLRAASLHYTRLSSVRVGMHYQRLGCSGLRVSELCLGTMTFGARQWGTSEQDAGPIYKMFRDAGGNFFDTANEIYSEGRSEEILGRLVKGHRDEAVIASKYSFHVPGTRNPNIAGNHRKSLKRSVEASLRRLDSDYIDVLWTHCWDGITPVEEVMRALDDLVRDGKILHVGVSNTPAWVVAQSNTLAELRGWTSFIGLQIEYNLIERAAERELLPMAAALGLSVCAWSPLASGILSGKYGDPLDTQSKRLDAFQLKPLDERSLAIARGVSALAARLERHPVHVALNWLRAKTGVVPLLGARTLEQLSDNLACLDFQLDAEQVASLDTLSAVELGYPHDFIKRTQGIVLGGFEGKIKP
ncbi:aldo/keto reductase [Pseudomonas sp. TYF_14]|uniref:aldo/keto reductase n=1 Tax=Pseudomonas sp. TYF_14 TaxID=3367193 RepID=UPI00370B6FF3